MAIFQLNLNGCLSPLCLMKTKNELSVLKRGDTLLITINDPVVFEDLLTIVGRSQDRVIAITETPECFEIMICKG
jgi:TusA-related sulfurtransferase